MSAPCVVRRSCCSRTRPRSSRSARPICTGRRVRSRARWSSAWSPTSASRATPTSARSPAAPCSPATAGCASTAARAPALTVDHVIPRSKGGGSGWDNIVAACAPCNRRKADRLPHQINMHPRTKPHTPGAHIFIQLASPTIPATWRQYLPQQAVPDGSPRARPATSPQDCDKWARWLLVGRDAGNAAPARADPGVAAAGPRSRAGARRAAGGQDGARRRDRRRADRPRGPGAGRAGDLLRRLRGAARARASGGRRRPAGLVRGDARRGSRGDRRRLGRRRHHALGPDLRRRQARGVRRDAPRPAPGRADLALRADQLADVPGARGALPRLRRRRRSPSSRAA